MLPPRVSVLLPSRGRPEKLRDALRSIYDTAKEPERVEAIVRTDSDDLSTLHEFANLSSLATFIIGPRELGYRSMDRFWNELAGAAQGRWLFFFNDDAIVTTDDWDAELDQYADPICIVQPGDNYRLQQDSTWTSFPICPKNVYLKLGHITRFFSVDNWLDDILAKPGVFPAYRTDAIFVQHMRPNIVGYEHLLDKTFTEGRSQEMHDACLEYTYDATGRWRKMQQEDIEALGRPL